MVHKPAVHAGTPTQERPFGTRFLPGLGLCLLAAGVLAAPGLLGRLFSSHGQFHEDVVQALETLRCLLLGTGCLLALGGILLRHRAPAVYRLVNGFFVNAALFIATLGIMLGLAEGVLRWADPWGVGQLRHAHHYFSRAVIPSPEPDLGYVHKPAFEGNLTGVPVTINRQGLRDREFTHERPPSVFRVLCLGDSVTFGWGIPSEDTFPKQLERSLNREETGPRFEVVNAGVGGYNAVQEAALYRTQLAGYETDLVLLFYTVNDASTPLPVLEHTPVDPHGRWRNLKSVSVGTFKRVFSTLFGFARYMTLPRIDYLADYRPGTDEGWQAAKAAIRSIHDQARERGARFAVFMVPAMQDLEPGYPYRLIHDMLGDLCRNEGIPFFDLFDDFEGMETMEVRISVFDGHPNRFAHRRIARAVEHHLAQTGLIPAPGRSPFINRGFRGIFRNFSKGSGTLDWIPASAGMTDWGNFQSFLRKQESRGWGQGSMDLSEKLRFSDPAGRPLQAGRWEAPMANPP